MDDDILDAAKRIVEARRRASENGLDDEERAAIEAEAREAGADEAPKWFGVPEEWFTGTPPPRQWLVRLPTRNGGECPPGHGDGLVPKGAVTLIASAGGVGKTYALVGLALAVGSGQEWLGHFFTTTGKVLLLLAEEDTAETRRRIWTVGRAMELTEEQIEAIASRVVVMPLAGVVFGLLDEEGDETEALAALRARMAQEGPWEAVVIDPLARVAGVNVEGDNHLATRLIQATETLCALPGNPAVLVSHHSSKFARRTDSADARGVTGLTDAARAVLTLRSEGGSAFLELSKGNYAPGMDEAVRLTRLDGGALRVETDAERRRREAHGAAANADALLADVDRVVQALAIASTPVTSVDAIARLAGLKAAKGRDAVKTAIDQGRIVQEGGKGDRIYFVRQGTERDGTTPKTAPNGSQNGSPIPVGTDRSGFGPREIF